MHKLDAFAPSLRASSAVARALPGAWPSAVNAQFRTLHLAQHVSRRAAIATRADQLSCFKSSRYFI